MSMSEKEERFRRRQRERLARYLELRDERGDAAAFEAVLDGYPEQQRRMMGPYIESRTLAAGFREVRDLFAELGIREEIVDVSTPERDAALEVLTVCMCRNACDELGVAQPSSLLCELDFEATRRAFPGMAVDVHHRVVDGAFACVFRYSRPASA
jgi:predicted ArsR family transcriptional regulator